ncbi:lytic transglycosylase domain-containing protein [Lichenibacterium ramalinae]|uniref:Lytic transglycosylase domain-containing protein n=1 Tax=Lichenibacterium ramalinae TaxID=2316527 RepID=A0A4Q2R9P2_9HYPH|nr:lytic transglycosylase domain-containing protein [Lichenibacterium ramalinae]RYB03614.1 lytic transglycosylase domain-containing protein [Lichenibacterium ramalinae]
MRFRCFRSASAILCAAALLTPQPIRAAPTPAGGETVAQALCRVITGAAEAQKLPVGFLTRLIWQESAFRAEATSPAGAQGIAQFMPGTAAERGLDDPFDPEKAVPASAALLAELSGRFGNLGLAAAAYNAGPRRVADWLAGRGGLPFETRDYVERITGRSAEDWAADAKAHATRDLAVDPQNCLQLAATLRTAPRRGGTRMAEAPFAPWGVQLAGNFSKSLALASFSRARASLSAVIGDIRPMVIGTRLRTRGTRAFYRVRVPANSRQEADALCRRIQAARGACVTLRS